MLTTELRIRICQDIRQLVRIYHSQEPLMVDYYAFMDLIKDKFQNIQFAADLSNRHWALIVARTLEKLVDPIAVDDLELGDHASDEASQAIAKENANLFLRLIIRMASHRAWSLSTWSEIAPEQWNGVLSSSHDDSRHAFAKMRQDADCGESFGCTA